MKAFWSYDCAVLVYGFGVAGCASGCGFWCVEELLLSTVELLRML